MKHLLMKRHVIQNTYKRLNKITSIKLNDIIYAYMRKLKIFRFEQIHFLLKLCA